MNQRDHAGVFRKLGLGVTRQREWLLVLLLLFPIALAYSSSLGDGFVYDDHFQIAHNPRIRSLHGVAPYFTRPVKLGSITEEVYQFHYRPLFWVSLALDYTVWRLNPFGYHLTSVLLHLGNATLLYFLLLRLLRRRSLAFATSLLWGLHPIHTEVVTWISSRAYSLSTTFGLLALLLFLTGQELQGWRKRAAIVGSAICVALALMTYEGAVSVPVLALLLDWARARQESRVWRPGPIHFLLWGVLAAYLLLRFTGAPLGESVGTWAGITNQLGARVLRIPGLLLVYLKLLAFPLHLSFDHTPEVPRPAALWSPEVWVPLGLLAGIAGLAWRLRRRSWLLLVGLAWFALAIAPVANILPLYKIIAERFLYLPSIGFLLAVVAAGEAALGKTTQAHPAYPWRRAAIAFLALLTLGYGLRVGLRNRDWRDDVTLFQATVAASPQSVLSYRNLGRAYLMARQYNLAEQAFQQAITLKPDFAHAFYGLGLAYQGQGRFQQAITALQRAVELSPRYAPLHVALGNVHLSAGNFDSAVTELQTALALDQASPEAHYILGLVYEREGKFDLAETAFQKARALDPTITAVPQEPEQR